MVSEPRSQSYRISAQSWLHLRISYFRFSTWWGVADWALPSVLIHIGQEFIGVRVVCVHSNQERQRAITRSLWGWHLSAIVIMADVLKSISTFYSWIISSKSNNIHWIRISIWLMNTACAKSSNRYHVGLKRRHIDGYRLQLLPWSFLFVDEKSVTQSYRCSRTFVVSYPKWFFPLKSIN